MRHRSVHLFLVLLALPTCSHGKSVEITLGLVLRKPSTLGAALLAIDDANSEGILQNFKVIAYTGLSTDCSYKVAIKNVLNMYTKKGINAIIGGRCSGVCEKVGLYLAHWNIAYFPESCTSQGIANKDSFRTTVRVGSVQSRIAQAVVDLFGFYKWRHAVMVTSGSSCKIFADSIQAAFVEADIGVAEIIMDSPDIDDILKRIRDRSKVVTVCMERDARNDFFLKAMDIGMTNGQYAYISYWFNPSPTIMEPWLGWKHADDEDMVKKLKTAMMSQKVITGAGLYGDVIDQMRNDMKDIEVKYNLTSQESSSSSVQVYEATYSYLSLVNHTLQSGLDPTNGHLIQTAAKNQTFKGYSTHVTFDEIADRKPIFNVYDIRPEWKFMKAFMEVDAAKSHEEHLTLIRKTLWAEGVDVAPVDDVCSGHVSCNKPDPETKSRPTFFERKREPWVVPLPLALTVVIIICAIGAISTIRNRRFEAGLTAMIWKIEKDDLTPINRLQLSTHLDTTTKTSSNKAVETLSVDVESHIVLYNGHSAVVRKIKRENSPISREELLNLRKWTLQMHENLAVFYGACLTPKDAFSVTEHCAKGTLMDILQHDTLNFDWSFKFSFITDLVAGMGYLHNTTQAIHGQLSSRVCMIDSRWTLKVSGFDLDILPSPSQDDLGSSLLWTAPEVLRNPESPKTKSSDVYSFAIILQEILTRDEPFFIGTCPYSTEEIIERVRERRVPPFRPQMEDYAGSDQGATPVLVKELLHSGWNENPDNRPTFDKAVKTIRQLNNGRKTNLLDDMVNLLEKYTSELERQVEKHTVRLVEEKKTTESLLHSLLPRPVAEKLVLGESVMVELFDSVTIYFSDVVGFSELCTRTHPMAVISILNDIYTICDNIIAVHDVYKMETVGDCYMVAGGLFNKCSDHLRKVAQMAIQVLSQISSSDRGILKENELMIRIGIHTGPCAAGIVGQKMPKYCVFGDTVNVASRMQTTGEGRRIHVSSKARTELMRYKEFATERRGTIEVKGKGHMETYWLTSSDGDVADQCV